MQPSFPAFNVPQVNNSSLWKLKKTCCAKDFLHNLFFFFFFFNSTTSTCICSLCTFHSTAKTLSVAIMHSQLMMTDEKKRRSLQGLAWGEKNMQISPTHYSVHNISSWRNEQGGVGRTEYNDFLPKKRRSCRKWTKEKVRLDQTYQQLYINMPFFKMRMRSSKLGLCLC